MSDQGEFPADAFAVEIFIEPEKGRFVVYMEVHFWEADSEEKITTRRHRIQDYPTRQKAEIAGRWIKATAERDIRHPPSGF
jgi:intergrase/recombinase